MDYKGWLEGAEWLNANIELNNTFGREYVFKVLDICNFKYNDDLAEQALSCITANLIANYYGDTPTIIPGSRDFWKAIKEACGIQWSTLKRVNDILRVLTELRYIDSVAGFKCGKNRAMARCWLKTDSPLIKMAKDFKGNLIHCCSTQVPSFTVRDVDGKTLEWRKLKHDSKIIDRMDKGIKRCNKFISKQDIGFNITLNELTEKKVNIVNALINMIPDVSTNKITLLINDEIIVRIRNVEDRDGSKKSKRRRVIVETEVERYNIGYLEELYGSTQCNNCCSYIELGTFDSTKYHLANDINGFGLFNLGHFKLSGIINYTAQSRIFNRESFGMGGRFYGGPWVNMNKIIRKKFIINDEKAVRVDFVGIHIKLLYHLKNLQFNGECYVYDKHENNEDRRRIKFIALIMINAKNQRVGTYAINKRLKHEGLFKSSYNTNKLIKIFKEYHNEISEYFFKDKGVELQKYDSTIMYNILKRLTKMRIPSISVHDEVIAPVKYKDIVEEVMLSEYKKETGFETTVS